MVGEASGDLLGSELVKGFLQKYPDVEFVGIGGKKLEEAGMNVWYDYQTLAVMGFSAVVMRIFPILKLFFKIKNRFLAEKIDLFIGIDAPDFNLKLSKQLKSHSIPCIHYVSPSFWAWREKFIHKIIRSTDMVMCLFPFEKPYYKALNFPIYFVGHPLAKDIKPVEKLPNLPQNQSIFGIIPGSRGFEIKHNLPSLVAMAKIIETNDGFIIFNAMKEKFVEKINALAQAQNLKNYTIQHGAAIETIVSSNFLIVKSGTVSLEVALHAKPLIVMYRYGLVNKIAIKLLRIKVKFMSLINWLYGAMFVPEFRQDEATPEAMAAEILAISKSPTRIKEQLDFFADIKSQLKNGDCSTTEAIEDFLGKRGLLS